MINECKHVLEIIDIIRQSLIKVQMVKEYIGKALYALDKCDLNVTPLSFIVKCDYASKIKSTLRIQPSDWL